MATENMNRVEMNNDELEMIFGSMEFFRPGTNFVYRCKKCGKSYTSFLGHKCLVFPKMDADNRPAITPPVFDPELRKA